MMSFGDIIGSLGVICFLTAYFLLQKGRLAHTQAEYLLLNLVGAVLIMISLILDWNLSAFLLEAAWAMISIYGIYKHCYKPWRSKHKHEP